jgi:ESS family glutamate:Na+ symporter
VVVLIPWAEAALVLVALLLVGRIGGCWLGLRAWGIPDALLAGALGLLLGPAGPRPLLPEAVISIWNGVPWCF